MKSKRILIDVATIYPGVGGTGGGIWSYSLNLLNGIDLQDPIESNVFLYCTVNSQHNFAFKRIRQIRIPGPLRNPFYRVLYSHVLLPIIALFINARLHKVFFEIPFFNFKKPIVTIHDHLYLRSSSKTIAQKYLRLMHWRAINVSSLILTPTETIRKETIEYYGVESDKVFAVLLGAQRQGFKSSVARKIEMKSVVNLFCIAAFHSHKGHLRLISLYNSLREVVDYEINLFLRGHVGDTEHYRKVLSAIEKSPYKDSIHIIKYQDKLDLHDMYSEADWLILLSEYEGFGLPLIESQTYSVPVICSDISVFKETVGESALILDMQREDNENAALIGDILNDSTSRNKYIHLGHINSKKYDWKVFSDETYNLYRNKVSA